MPVVPTLPSSPIPVVEDAPVDFSVAGSFTVGTSWTTIVDSPDWDIPQSANEPIGTSTPVDGIAQLTSALYICNLHTAEVLADVQIIRDSGAGILLVKQMRIPVGETAQIGLNGLILYTRDLLQVKSNVAASLGVHLNWSIGVPERLITRS